MSFEDFFNAFQKNGYAINKFIFPAFLMSLIGLLPTPTFSSGGCEKTALGLRVDSIYDLLSTSTLRTNEFLISVFDQWLDEWKKRTTAQDRMRELASKGHTPLEIIRILEGEGLSEYMFLLAGRPGAMSGKEVVSILQRAGWQHVRTKGSHFIMRGPSGTTMPVPVHGNQTLQPGFIRAMLKQAGITPPGQ